MDQTYFPDEEFLETIYARKPNHSSSLTRNLKRKRFSDNRPTTNPSENPECSDDNNRFYIPRRKYPSGYSGRQYKLCPDPSKSVCGSFHQNSEGQGLSEFRGTQCTSIALAAILTAHSLLVANWTSGDLDTILRFGDSFHKKLVTNRDRQGIDSRVSIHELEQGDSIWYTMPAPVSNIDWSRDRTTQLALSIHKSEENFGFVNAKINFPGDTSFGVGLDKLLRAYESVLLTVGDKTVAIMKNGRENIKLLDSHSNNRIGRIHPDGTSVLMTFDTSRELVRHLRRRSSCPLDRFEMVGINVKCHRRTAIVKPMRRNVIEID